MDSEQLIDKWIDMAAELAEKGAVFSAAAWAGEAHASLGAIPRERAEVRERRIATLCTGLDRDELKIGADKRVTAALRILSVPEGLLDDEIIPVLNTRIELAAVKHLEVSLGQTLLDTEYPQLERELRAARALPSNVGEYRRSVAQILKNTRVPVDWALLGMEEWLRV